MLDSHRHTWRAYTDRKTPTETYIKTSVLAYTDSRVVTFDVEYVTGLTNNEDKVDVVSSFPSFVYEEGELERGWMTWSGNSK